MTALSLEEELGSGKSLVAVEAPAGCGKTYEAVGFTARMAVERRRTLILTHTHAARSEFLSRAPTGHRPFVRVRTLDGFICEIAAAYHLGLGLPQDVMSWAVERKNGYEDLAVRVAKLLTRFPMISKRLSTFHPLIVCDEHQDANADQDAVISSLRAAGSRIRIFADPMQNIFGPRKPLSDGLCELWARAVESADSCKRLSTPHRWERGGCSELGAWTLVARERLSRGGSIDLRGGLPASVVVATVSNVAKRRLEFQFDRDDRQPIDSFIKASDSLMVLTRFNDTASSLRSVFNRRIPLWEGQVRKHLQAFTASMEQSEGDGPGLAAAVVEFVRNTTVGLSQSAFGNALMEEVATGCLRKRRGRPLKIQGLAQELLARPNHQGACSLLLELRRLLRHDPQFRGAKIDRYREFRDAVSLGKSESLKSGIESLQRLSLFSVPKPPPLSISTIHKAKGLECTDVAILPCDRNGFRDDWQSRCLLYVGLSRATSRLLLVVSRDDPSPLLDY